MSKTVFITGATGLIGGAVAELAIKEHGFQVRGLSRHEKGDEKLRAMGATPVRGELKDLAVLEAEAAKADIVCHLADSFADTWDLSKYDEVIKLEQGILEAFSKSLKGSNKALVTTSGSLMAEADPNGGETDETAPYPSKPFINRHLIEANNLSKAKEGIRVMNIRLAPYVYGRGLSGIGLFMGMAHKNKQAIIVDGGTAQTSTVYVDDAARLYLLVAEKGVAGENYNCTVPGYPTQKELTEAYASMIDVPVKSISHEEAVNSLGPFFTSFLVSANRASNKKAVGLGWKPSGPSIFDEIKNGSYKAVAEKIKSGAS